MTFPDSPAGQAWLAFDQRRRQLIEADDVALIQATSQLLVSGQIPGGWPIEIRCAHGHGILTMTLDLTQGGGQTVQLFPPGPPPVKNANGQVIHQIVTGEVSDETTVDYRLRFVCWRSEHGLTKPTPTRKRTPLLVAAIRRAFAGEHALILDS